MPPKSPSKKSTGKGITKKSAKADKNNDGKTTRSEAKDGNLKVSAADLNDDGRVTRSEARKLAKVKPLK